MKFRKEFNMDPRKMKGMQPLYTDKWLKKSYMLMHVYNVFITLASIIIAINSNINHLLERLNLNKENVIVFMLLLMIIVLLLHVILMFIHELLHIIALPGGIFSNNNYIIAGKSLVVSSAHDGITSKKRLLFSLITPFVFMNFLLCMLILLLKEYAIIFIVYLLNNSAMCFLDINLFIYVLFKTPRNAVFYQSWYK